MSGATLSPVKSRDEHDEPSNDTVLSFSSEYKEEESPPDHSRDPEKAHTSTSNIVDWNGASDPENPLNLPLPRKWLITISLSLTNFTTTFASSIFSTTNGQTAELFHVSGEVMVLGTSLYLAGFIFGPFIFGSVFTNEKCDCTH